MTSSLIISSENFIQIMFNVVVKYSDLLRKEDVDCLYSHVEEKEMKESRHNHTQT